MDLITEYFSNTSEAHIASMVALAFTYIFHALNLSSNRKERKVLKVAPSLKIKDFQVAPLGRDALFLIKNTGANATISNLKIIGRDDLMIKNDFGGHKVETDKEYRIFLETQELVRIDNNFKIELTFLDEQGNTFIQTTNLKDQKTTPLKIVKIV